MTFRSLIRGRREAGNKEGGVAEWSEGVKFRHGTAVLINWDPPAAHVNLIRTIAASDRATANGRSFFFPSLFFTVINEVRPFTKHHVKPQWNTTTQMLRPEQIHSSLVLFHHQIGLFGVFFSRKYRDHCAAEQSHGTKTSLFPFLYVWELVI